MHNLAEICLMVRLLKCYCFASALLATSMIGYAKVYQVSCYAYLGSSAACVVNEVSNVCLGVLFSAKVNGGLLHGTI